MKAIKHGLTLVFLAGLLIAPLFTFSQGVAYAGESTTTDTAEGTANNTIEAAIKAGKTLIGKTGYGYGAGHSDSDPNTTATIPKSLDCSAFVRWAYNIGAGKDMGSLTIQAYGVDAPGTIYHKFKKYVKKGSWEQMKRGDIAFIHGGGHTGIALGDGKIIAADGANDALTPTDGVRMSGTGPQDFDHTVYDGYYVDMDAATKDDSLWVKGANPVDTAGGTGGSSDSSDSADGDSTTTDQKEAWYNPLIKFLPRKTSANKVGTSENTESTGFMTASFVVPVSAFVNKIYDWTFIVAVAISFVFTGYMTIVMIVYFAVIPRGFEKPIRVFEKVTQLDGTYSKANTITILSRAGIALVLLAIFYSGAYLYIYTGLFNLIAALVLGL